MWPFKKKPKPRYCTPRAGLPAYRYSNKREWGNFKGAQSGDLVYGWATDNLHIDAILQQDLRVLRSRSREQARNNDYVRRFIAMCENNIVGPEGIQAHSTVLDDNGQLNKPVNDAIEAAWADWKTGHCDIAERLTFHDIQRLFIRSLCIDGEFIAIEHTGEDKGKYGYQLEIIDAERLDLSKNQQASNGEFIRLGVQYAANGKPTQYWLNDIDKNGQYRRGNSKAVDASKVIHVFLSDWIGQSRGIPWISTALFRLKMLSGYEDAAITAARLGASKAGFYKSEAGDDYTGDDKRANEDPIHEVTPGSWEQLPPGFEVQTYDPTYPHDQFPEFMARTLRGVSSGLNVPYESLSNDREGVNYSSIRTGELDARDTWKLLQGFMIDRFIRPVRERWLTNASKAILNLPAANQNTSAETYQAARYQGRRWEWVDPQKEANAQKTAVELGVVSRSELIRNRGRDPEDVYLEIEAEQKKMRELGIPITSAAAPAYTEPEEENDNAES